MSNNKNHKRILSCFQISLGQLNKYSEEDMQEIYALLTKCMDFTTKSSIKSKSIGFKLFMKAKMQEAIVYNQDRGNVRAWIECKWLNLPEEDKERFENRAQIKVEERKQRKEVVQDVNVMHNLASAPKSGSNSGGLKPKIVAITVNPTDLKINKKQTFKKRQKDATA